MALARTAKNLAKRSFGAGLRVVRQFDPEAGLLLLGDPRGGTTWLAELIHETERTAICWEPLALRDPGPFRDLGFSHRQYIPPGASWPEAKAAFTEVLQGRRLNHRTLQLSSPWSYLRAEHLIVKFCRGSALLPWLVRQFDFRFKPVLLLRHPFAVAASQLRHGSWAGAFEGAQIPSGPYAAIHEPYRDYVAALESREEALVAIWCLANRIPLVHGAGSAPWMTVHYEHLVRDPLPTLEAIYAEWGLALPSSLEARVRVPSATTRQPVADSVDSQLAKWRSVFEPDQVARMLAVLEHFEISVYGDGVDPRV